MGFDALKPPGALRGLSASGTNGAIRVERPVDAEKQRQQTVRCTGPLEARDRRQWHPADLVEQRGDAKKGVGEMMAKSARESPKIGRRNVICFSLSAVMAVWYFASYWDHKIGVSPFHIGTRLPIADWIELFLLVVLPLAIGICCGFAAGPRLRWYVLAAYPIVILASLL